MATPVPQQSHAIAPVTGRAPAAGDGEVAVAQSLMLAVLRVLAEPECYGRQRERLLRELATALGQTAATLWLAQGRRLVPAVVWSAPGVDGESLARVLHGAHLEWGVGLAGRAWALQTPVAGQRGERPVRGPGAPDRPRPLRAGLAFPCCDASGTVAVLALYGPERLELSDQLREVLVYAGRSIGALLARRRGELGLSPLTPRELEVLTLAGSGLSVREIAGELTIAPATVKTHLEHIYRKLGVRDRTGAVARALRAGYIE